MISKVSLKVNAEMCEKIVENFCINNSINKYKNLNKMCIIMENKLKIKKLDALINLKFFNFNQIWTIFA